MEIEPTTFGLRVRFRATRQQAVQQEPIKSARRAKSFRLVSDGFVHRSRTVTRTILAHSRPRSLNDFLRGPREGWEAKVVSAVQAQHDSVGHLLESRCTAATSEVFEALRERARRSIEDADVIEREDLAGFAAPLDSALLSAHGKLGNSHSLIYSRLEDLAARVRRYCRPADLCSTNRRNQRRFAELRFATKANLSRHAAFSSACRADVPLQVIEFMSDIYNGPRSVRVLEEAARAN